MNDTWDHEVILITKNSGKDSIGQSVGDGEKQEIVLCKENPIGRADRYRAGLRDIELKALLVVHPYEYSGQTNVEYEGQMLTVEHVYPINQEELELTCSDKRGIKNGNKN